MSRRKMIGAHVTATPKRSPRNSNAGRDAARDFNRAYDVWAQKPGRTHLAFAPAALGRQIL